MTKRSEQAWARRMPFSTRVKTSTCVEEACFQAVMRLAWCYDTVAHQQLEHRGLAVEAAPKEMVGCGRRRHREHLFPLLLGRLVKGPIRLHRRLNPGSQTGVLGIRRAYLRLLG
jgi:hypothetical protein